MKEFDFPDPYLLVSNFNPVNHADNVTETSVFKLMSYTRMVTFLFSTCVSMSKHLHNLRWL